MNWRNIVILSLLGLPITLLTIFGVIPSAAAEGAAWLVPGLLIAWMLRRSARPFLSGLLCGVLIAVMQHLLNIALWDTYVANNAELAAQITAAATDRNMSVTMFQLISAPIVGLIYGAVLGLLAWGASKMERKAGAPREAQIPA